MFTISSLLPSDTISQTNTNICVNNENDLLTHKTACKNNFQKLIADVKSSVQAATIGYLWNMIMEGITTVPLDVNGNMNIIFTNNTNQRSNIIINDFKSLIGSKNTIASPSTTIRRLQNSFVMLTLNTFICSQFGFDPTRLYVYATTYTRSHFVDLTVAKPTDVMQALKNAFNKFKPVWFDQLSQFTSTMSSSVCEQIALVRSEHCMNKQVLETINKYTESQDLPLSVPSDNEAQRDFIYVQNFMPYFNSLMVGEEMTFE